MLEIIIHYIYKDNYYENTYQLDSDPYLGFHLKFIKGNSPYLKADMGFSKDLIMLPLFGLLPPPMGEKFHNMLISYIEFTDSPINTISNMIKTLQWKPIGKYLYPKKMLNGVLNQNDLKKMKIFFIRYLYEADYDRA